jgi:hypothetical protein
MTRARALPVYLGREHVRNATGCRPGCWFGRGRAAEEGRRLAAGIMAAGAIVAAVGAVLGKTTGLIATMVTTRVTVTQTVTPAPAKDPSCAAARTAAPAFPAWADEHMHTSGPIQPTRRTTRNHRKNHHAPFTRAVWPCSAGRR